MRVDENRGAGSPPGNGTCGTPGSYNPGYNAQTLFQLFYFREGSDGSPVRVDLANYTGQVGDGIRDSGDRHVYLDVTAISGASENGFEIWAGRSSRSIRPLPVGAFLSQSVLNSHVDLERTLRLLIWDTVEGSGSSSRFRIAGFAVFPLHGYRLSQSTGGSWLLLEFIRWDTFCGQPPIEAGQEIYFPIVFKE